ncbi:MAG: hypothetical protein AAF734_06625 [Bacteroidota bacterium]
MQIIKIKEWCDANITPMAWQRVALKILPDLREQNISLSEIQNPNDSLVIENRYVIQIDNIIQELYEVELPKELKVI